MPSRSEVEKHYKTVRSQEDRALHDGVLNRAYNLSDTRWVAANISRKFVVPEVIYPRQGLRLFAAAFTELFFAKGQKPQLATFITEDLMPICGLAPPTNEIQTVIGGERRDPCKDAETYFVECLSQINGQSEGRQTRISVYHTPEGTPLAIRKSYEQSTALTLQPAELIPAGTIASISYNKRAKTTGKTTLSRDYYCSLATYQVDGELELAPLRISPWAYDDPIDRALFAVTDNGQGKPHYSERRAELITGHNLDDFRQAADQVMQLCGVKSVQ